MYLPIYRLQYTIVAFKKIDVVQISMIRSTCRSFLVQLPLIRNILQLCSSILLFLILTNSRNTIAFIINNNIVTPHHTITTTIPGRLSAGFRRSNRSNNNNDIELISSQSSLQGTRDSTRSRSSNSIIGNEVLPEETTLLLQDVNDNNNEDDDNLCELGMNIVDECSTLPSTDGTESKLSVSTNLAKCICGAGSFALPKVFLEEGILGGLVAITVCGVLCTVTMQSLSDSKLKASSLSSTGGGSAVTSYVQLAKVSGLGNSAAKVVFILTLCASLGVCSTYLVFIGQTLESMSYDDTVSLVQGQGPNIVRLVAPDISRSTWEFYAAIILLPLSLIRDYSIFAFTSALGVFAVVGGIVVTLAYGIFVEPGNGLASIISYDTVRALPMWPQSIGTAFGGSFGTICYLFAINFLTFPIMNSIKEPKQYNGAVSNAVGGVWIVNVVFAIIALSFYKDDTQDLVLANLSNGPYLSALKLLLCIDLLFTFPIVFSSGRQILENSLLNLTKKRERNEDKNDNNTNNAIINTNSNTNDETTDVVSFQQRSIIVGCAVGFCYMLAQIGGFGVVANLVGGVAQGTLAFIMPSAVALSLAKKRNEILTVQERSRLYLIAIFGTICVGFVTYFTASEIFVTMTTTAT